MLQIHGGPFLAPSSEMFKKGVARTIDKDHKGLDKLARGDLSLPSADSIARWLHVPGPAKIRPAAHPPSERQETVPEENPALDEVRKPVEDLVAPLKRYVSKFRDSQARRLP